MERIFELLYNDSWVGHVCVIKQGLYYNIKCCILNNCGERPHVTVTSERGVIDLGECMQSAERISLERNLPIRLVGKQLDRFSVRLSKEKHMEYVLECSPFHSIEKLGNAVMQRKTDGTVIIFENC